MKPIRALFSTVIATTAIVSSSVFAQTDAVKTDAVQWRMITLKNVPPDLMAYMIDPKHNPVPNKVIAPVAQVPTKATTEKLPRANGGIFDLPAGVDSMVPAVSQNGLLIQSTEEGARQLQNIVDLLDRPMRQVEIKTQVVELNNEAMEKLGLDFTYTSGLSTVGTKENAGKTATFQLGFARDDYQASLSQLVEQNKAKIVAEFGVTVTNNMTGSMGVARSAPAIVGTKDETGNFKTQFDATQNTPASRLLLTTEAGFFVTPTINNDGTITLVMQASKTMQLTMGEKETGVMLPFGSNPYNRRGAGLPQRTADGIALSEGASPIQTVVNLKDGNTIVLLSPSLSIFGTDLIDSGAGQTIPDAKTLVLFTAHVLSNQK